jgi:predicted permease
VPAASVVETVVVPAASVVVVVVCCADATLMASIPAAAAATIFANLFSFIILSLCFPLTYDQFVIAGASGCIPARFRR